MKLSKEQARRVFLRSQGLCQRFATPFDIIQRLTYVQVDTISVVERAHHHVFWSRLPTYKPMDLDKLVSERQVFEYWSHAASFLPMTDYRFSLPRKTAFRPRESSWWPRNPKLMGRVLDRIRSEGPLSSKDFDEETSVVSGWGNSKPAKKALERLFHEGRLEISERRGFQKYYDLTENVIPTGVSVKSPTKSEMAQKLIENVTAHHGLATLREISYLRGRDMKSLIATQLDRMVAKGQLNLVEVEGLQEPYYARLDVKELTRKVPSKVHILSPFDNAVIQRKKLADLFDFSYQIECYVPAAKRKHGYFCLPVLYGDRFVGRLDCKADRKAKKLNVLSQHWETSKGAGEQKQEDFLAVVRPKVAKSLGGFARFNGCKEVVTLDSNFRF